MFSSIKSKLLIRILTIIVVGVSVIGFLGCYLNYASTISTLESTMTELALQCSVRLQNRLARYLAIVTELAMDTRFSDPEVSDAEREELLAGRQEGYDFISHGYLTRDGIGFDGVDYSSTPLYTRPMQGESFVSNPTWVGDTQIFYFVAPIREGGVFDGECVGSIYFGLDGDVIHDIVSDIVVGNTGRCYIMDSEGTYIANPNNDLVVKQTNNVKRPDESTADYACRNELEGQALKMTDTEETLFGEINGGGANKYLAFSKIKNTYDWVIGVSADVSEYMDETQTAIIATIIIAVVLIVVACIVCITTSNSIVKPLRKTAKVMESVASGNLDVNVGHKSKDEIGVLSKDIDTTILALRGYVTEISRLCQQLAEGNFDIHRQMDFQGDFVKIIEALNSLSDDLSNTMEGIDIAASQVSSGASQISEGATSLASGTTEQASAVEELASIIATLNDKVSVNAQSAADANSKAVVAGKSIEQSNQHMQDMINAMDNISDKSSQISKIIKTIEDIAFQTNILALNAAIEAARAGTLGKGFAVVADEVRSLASQSSEAAQSTTELIQQCLDAVNSGSEIANETASALNESVKATNETVQLISEISIASREQASMIEQVNVGIDQISSVVQTNAATAEESAASSGELNGQASALQGLTNKFVLKKA